MASLLKGLVTCSLLSLFTLCLSYQMPNSVSLGITNKILTQVYNTAKFPCISYALWYTDRCKSTCTISLENRKTTRKKKDSFLVLVHFLCLIILISLKENALGWRGGMQNRLIFQINRQCTFSERRRKEFYQTIFLWAIPFD